MEAQSDPSKIPEKVKNLEGLYRSRLERHNLAMEDIKTQEEARKKALNFSIPEMTARLVSHLE